MKNFDSKLKNIAFILILVFLLFFMASNNYSLQNIDELAYVVALGMDVSDSNNLKLSIQISKPSDISSSSSSSSEQSSSSIVDSVECSSIQEGMNLFNSYISRTINLSHCKVIVISEELAARDISSYLLDLSNNIEISGHANLIITKCDASSYLKMTNPTLEIFTARYYNIVNTSSISTAYTKGTTLIDFFSTYTSNFQEPISVLANINNSETHVDPTLGSYLNKDNSYIAGQTPITSHNNIENMGLAIFKDGKLVGELNALESICHMIVSGELDYCQIQIQDNENISIISDLKLNQKKKPKVKLKFINGSPYINLDINLEAQVVSVSGTSTHLNNTTISSLETSTNKYLEKIIYNYLYKISKIYNSDIDGFGKYAMKYFTTTNQFNDYNWLDNFKNSFFKLHVNTIITSSNNFISS